MTVKTEDVHRNLVDARALVANGWLQGTGRSGDSYCALGGVYHTQPGVMSNWIEWTKVGQVSLKILEYCLPTTFLHGCSPVWLRHISGTRRLIPAYNDHSMTAKEDILALFDRAIAMVAPVPQVKPTVVDTRELVPA